MFKALVRQFNIIKALAIHNLQGQMKSYNYGFAWTLIDPLIFIAVFRMARKAFGGSASPPGMTPLLFYVLGIFPLYLFMEGMKAGRSVESPSKLLYFPRVTQIDIALGSAVSSLAVYLLLFFLVAPAIAAYENVLVPQNLSAVIFALMISWIMGLGLGFTFSGITRVLPPMKTFIGYMNFGVRIGSGLFFCIRDIPPAYWPYLSWNPLLHATEVIRDGWYETYTSPIANPMFIMQCTLGLLLFGLSIERFMRRVPYV